MFEQSGVFVVAQTDEADVVLIDEGPFGVDVGVVEAAADLVGEFRADAFGLFEVPGGGLGDVGGTAEGLFEAARQHRPKPGNHRQPQPCVKFRIALHG